jgi:hypothetical protein
MAPVPIYVPRRTRRSLRGMRWARRATSLRSLARYRGSSERATRRATIGHANAQQFKTRGSDARPSRGSEPQTQRHTGTQAPAWATTSWQCGTCHGKSERSCVFQKAGEFGISSAFTAYRKPWAGRSASPAASNGASPATAAGGVAARSRSVRALWREEEGVAHRAGGAQCACALINLCLC